MFGKLKSLNNSEIQSKKFGKIRRSLFYSNSNLNLNSNFVWNVSLVFNLLNVVDLKVAELIPVALKEEMKPSANYFKGELDRILTPGNTKSISFLFLIF
jgi:hypothetical protein